MGLTAESVQVRVKQDSPEATRRRIAGAAREFLRKQGFEEVAEAGAADRIVTLGPAEGQRWIAVFDTLMGSAGDFAKLLSRESGGAAVSMVVFDSDDVFVGLAEDGQLADRFERAEGKTRRADPRRWAQYADPEALREVFAAEPLFAEDQLRRLAEALGMNGELCLTPADEAGGAGFLHLYFRHQSSPRGSARDASGPPSFEGPSPQYRPFELGLGEAVWQSITAYVTNSGGAGRGVRITAGGSAVERGILAIQGVRILRAGQMQAVEYPLGTGRWVELPDLPLAAGPGPRAGRPDPKNPRANIVTAQVAGSAAAVGEGTLTLTFQPLQNPVRGAAVRSFDIVVRPRARVPLKADGAAPGTQQFMRVMEDPRSVVAVASLRPPAGTRSAALAAIEQWIAFLTPLRSERWLVLQAGSNAMVLPKEHRSVSSNLLMDKVWRKVREKFEQCAYCSGHLGDERREGDAMFAGSAGWGFDPSAVPAAMLPVSFSPQLGFWLDTRLFPPEEVLEAEARIAAIFDELLASGHVFQAFTARWNMGDLSSVPMTPYEMACGVQGQCTTTERWCRRFLRGVGDCIWIGPDLVAHLDPAALAALGAMASEAGVRITRPAEASLDQVERALEPILAGRAEWAEGMRAMYTRG